MYSTIILVIASIEKDEAILTKQDSRRVWQHSGFQLDLRTCVLFLLPLSMVVWSAIHRILSVSESNCMLSVIRCLPSVICCALSAIRCVLSAIQCFFALAFV